MDRTIALKLFSGAKTRTYPTREALIRFGRTVCLIARPEDTIDRIATAMTDTLAANATRLDQAYEPRLAEKWKGGHRALARARRHPVNPPRA